MSRTVRVDWLDARTAEGPWVRIRDAVLLSPARCRSYVRVLVDDPHYLVLASHVGDDADDDEIGGVISIPRGCVLQITELAEREPQAKT